VESDCETCPIIERLKFANDLIVELQHQIRELRHEVDNHAAGNAGWPLAQEST
jgi:hypothetical protein